MSVRISELPVATAPQPDDEMVINQGGATKKVPWSEVSPDVANINEKVAAAEAAATNSQTAQGLAEDAKAAAEQAETNAEAAAAAAEAAAATIPAIAPGDAGKAVVVKGTEDGYELSATAPATQAYVIEALQRAGAL